MKSIYIIGSLKNKKIVEVGNVIRAMGIEAFDDWMAPGPDADDYWRDYTKARGLTYREALQGYAAQHVFEFDKYHLDRCDAALMVMPAGKSGHLELGYTLGKGKPGWILLDEEQVKAPEFRYDVMTQFADRIFENLVEFQDFLEVDYNVGLTS